MRFFLILFATDRSSFREVFLTKILRTETSTISVRLYKKKTIQSSFNVSTSTRIRTPGLFWHENAIYTVENLVHHFTNAWYQKWFNLNKFLHNIGTVYFNLWCSGWAINSFGLNQWTGKMLNREMVKCSTINWSNVES